MQGDVLGLLRRESGALSAYALLAKLRESNPRLAPQTVYRALQALTERRLVHRLESLNAYFACRHGHHSGASILSVCDGCGAVEECVAPDVLAALSNVADRTGFAPMRHVVEMRGVCADCGGAAKHP
ncbi:MAG: Fur family transcriptional regulator [Pseudomonadota bacterium]